MKTSPPGVSGANAPCILCGKSADVSLLEKRGDFTILYCGACALRFSDPMTHPGRDFYEDSSLYDNRASSSVSLSLPELDWKCRTLYRAARAPAGSTLLDIGCGDGGLLAMGRDRGLNVSGIEIDARGVRIAREVRHLPRVEQGDFSRLDDLGWGGFDRVTLFEVLEHLSEPKDVVRRLFTLLRPGGIAVVTVPRWDRSPAFFDPETDYPPHHFTFWTQRSLELLFREAGFTQVRVLKAPFQLQSLFYVLQSRLKKPKKAGEAAPAEAGPQSAAPAEEGPLRVNQSRVLVKKLIYTVFNAINPLLAWIPGLRGSTVMVLGTKP